MKMMNFASTSADSINKQACICNILPVATFLCVAFFIASAFIATDYRERTLGWESGHPVKLLQSSSCKNYCKPRGSEALPKGIVNAQSNLEMRPLWDSTRKVRNTESLKSLLAISVGIKQKVNVNQIVKKFPLTDFTILLFHYDGTVDEWRDLQWCDTALHVSAINQTKWWFAKRFLHPDIVASYKYIFLWDEDLGVENFDPVRYLQIVESEGLEISQPALDPVKSLVHHQITVRSKKSRVHRRMYKYNGGGRCYANSTAPPCTGWVEMMAPVFSKAAWRCVWYMIQTDLIHAWGLDMKLGYCAQGDRSKNVGVVDEEYIVHQGIATLGGHDEHKVIKSSLLLCGLYCCTHSGFLLQMCVQLYFETSYPPQHESTPEMKVPDFSRTSVRRQSYIDLEIFKRRWRKSVREDKCWTDPYRSHGKSW